MKKISETIVFFGSGPVAAKALELLSEWIEIEAVVTKPQPPHHKEPFPVLLAAKKLELKVFTPSNKKELSALFATNPVKSRLGMVIDYGFIINQDVIDYFPLGIINSHFSVLPEWRGADPITFAILSGQETTGVSIMQLVKALDEGPLLSYGEIALKGSETTPELTNELIILSDQLLRQDLPKYLVGKIEPTPQTVTSREVSYSRKLVKEDGILDWNKPATQLEREIRAFIEWPKSHAVLAGQSVIVTQASVVNAQGKPGEIRRPNKSTLIVCCGKQALEIERLKPAGKSEMSAQAFLAGYGKKISG